MVRDIVGFLVRLSVVMFVLGLLLGLWLGLRVGGPPEGVTAMAAALLHG